MNRRAFVSIIRMRAGHSSLKTSSSRFNIVSTAECKCGDGLQMEERIFWDRKPYEDERAKMMDILSEKSKKRIPKFSYRPLKATGKKICERRLLLHTKNS
jgi:hypothetical protein